ncbi:hypothetical protein G3545_13920 [Starkeya sp. ORNL1]|uniref:hypothetical protein n=1 Tax=Starkeya sp. ORNL1 TaxID=2709380 RepID=UPI001462E31C|nr:hypothetical protein [Starkeya sp. ORNL1]QJP14641.1 hypothetical protein G3545_13920 [Starkeya sp. ORNL1]
MADASPPRSPVLLSYGEALPDFLESFAPVAGLPYLANVARLEIARGQAHHAADAAPVTAEALAVLDPRRPGVRVGIHPAVRLIRSAYPVATLWAMNAGAQTPAAIDEWSDAGLYPRDLRQRAMVDKWPDWSISSYGPLERELYWGLVRTRQEERDMPALNRIAGQLSSLWQIVDAHLSGRRYATGGDFYVGRYLSRRLCA